MAQNCHHVISFLRIPIQIHNSYNNYRAATSILVTALSTQTLPFFTKVFHICTDMWWLKVSVLRMHVELKLKQIIYKTTIASPPLWMPLAFSTFVTILILGKAAHLWQSVCLQAWPRLLGWWCWWPPAAHGAQLLADGGWQVLCHAQLLSSAQLPLSHRHQAWMTTSFKTFVACNDHLNYL